MSDAHSQATNTAGSLAGQMEEKSSCTTTGTGSRRRRSTHKPTDCRPSVPLPRLSCRATGCHLVQARPNLMPPLPPHAKCLLPVGFLLSVPCGGAYESQSHRQNPGARYMHGTDKYVTFLTMKETHIKTVKTSTFSSSSRAHV